MNPAPGFVKADSANLPSVNVNMIHEFYMKNLQYLSSESRSAKNNRAAREEYGDNAISYVQLRREGDMCTVCCKITPEHKLHKVAYNVEVIVNEKENTVCTCQCKSCAAALGGCKHAIAVLYWLHRRSEEPSSTSKECYWKGSTLGKVGRSQKHMSLKEMTGRERQLEAKSDSFREAFISTMGKQEGGIFDLYNASEIGQFSMYQILLVYKEDINKNCSKEFLQYCKNSLGSDFATVEQLTREQSGSADWYEMRFGRITASKVYEAARCKTSDGYLMEVIMGANKPFETEATSRGKTLEPLVIKRVEKMKGIKISKVGFLLHKDYPAMGASPDGVSAEYCIEVKCPSTEKTMKNYIDNGVISKKYYYQLQMQMLFAQKEKGLFCIASPKFENDKNVTIHEVSLNKVEILEVMEHAMAFWETSVFPALLKM